ncbi:MAG: phage tail assembly chaperone [Sphingomicrobium sp.]
MTLGEARDERMFGEAAARAWQAAALALHWRPKDFWDCTPAELAGALVSPDDFEPPSKDMIDALIERFPDRKD